MTTETTSTVAIVPSEPAAPVPIDDGVQRSLDPRSVTLERIAGMILTGIVSLVLIGGVTVPVILVPLTGSTAIAMIAGAVSISLLLNGWVYKWAEISHRYKSYTVSPASIEIRKGVIWRKVVSLPRSRVQHTDVSQGPLERRFGLGTLVIYTAGTAHSKVDLHGLDHDTASRIRDHLLPVEDSDAV